MKIQTAVALWILMSGVAMAQTMQTGVWMGSGPLAGAPAVQNAPFSAELVTTVDRSTDGTPGFHHETQGKVARNSQGVTYFEMQLPSPNPRLNKGTRVTITDPTQHTVTTLDPQQKTAFVNHNYNRWNTGGALPPGGALAVPLTGTATPSPTTGDPTIRKTNPSPAATASTASMSGASADGAAQQGVKTEQLGSQVIEGLTVTGVRTIRTNSWSGSGEDKTFTATTDTWTSPKLGVIVLSETTDSMGTHRVSKLTDIVRTEPDAALFQVPAGYTVKESAPRASGSSGG